MIWTVSNVTSLVSMETGYEQKRHESTSVFLIHINQTKKNLEGSVTQELHRETVQPSRLASALGRASGLELVEGLVWERGQ